MPKSANTVLLAQLRKQRDKLLKEQETIRRDMQELQNEELQCSRRLQIVNKALVELDDTQLKPKQAQCDLCHKRGDVQTTTLKGCDPSKLCGNCLKIMSEGGIDAKVQVASQAS